MALNEWQKRVAAERDELHERIRKLQWYLEANPGAAKILWAQLSAMQTYLDILDLRIDEFLKGEVHE